MDIAKEKVPILGISASIIVDQGGMFPGYHRSYVNEDYVSAISKNGGIPLVLPVTNNPLILKSYLNLIDGLLLSGGHDVCPQNYQEEPLPKLGDTFPERDQFDFQLLKMAEAKGIPILGICRGFQIIDVFHGGNLWQDLSYVDKPLLKHWQEHHPELVTHTVDLAADSQLSGILNSPSLMVNSFHHQIVKEVAEEFNVVARSRDGVVEAIENPDYPFLIGVQWHPEMLHESQPEMNKLFQAFINSSLMCRLDLDQQETEKVC